MIPHVVAVEWYAATDEIIKLRWNVQLQFSMGPFNMPAEMHREKWELLLDWKKKVQTQPNQSRKEAQRIGTGKIERNYYPEWQMRAPAAANFPTD